MKLFKKFTGIALSVCIAVSPIQVKADTTPDPLPDLPIYTSDILAQAQESASYILSQWGSKSDDIYSYRELLLLTSTPQVDHFDVYDAYMHNVSKYITSDGKIVVDGSEHADVYAGVIALCPLGGYSADNFDFKGINLLDSFDKYLMQFKTADELNTAIGNPYHYSCIISVVNTYRKEMADSEAIMKLLKEAVLLNYSSDSSGCGIDYYGYSTDTNGKVIPALNYFIKSDNTLFDKYVSDVIRSTLKLKSTNNAFGYSTTYTDPNADSTALALALFSTYGITENTADTYKALLTYKSSTTKGCYTYGGKDSYIASVDALEGILTYYNSLTGRIPSPYDASRWIVRDLWSVTLYANGGKLKKVSNILLLIEDGTYLKEVKIITPLRKGYVFSGWYTAKTGGKKISSSYEFTKDIDLYAHWTKITVAKPIITKAIASKKKAVITHKKISGVSGYSISYSLYSNFKKCTNITTKKTSNTITGLKSGKIYYFKVKAFKNDPAGNKIYGQFSSVKKVKIK